MFFKKIEIHGFKSFCHKTLIDLDKGLTIIVGPNGCGKSNIFDAVRWVLGEQSAKSLRGGRMGDVIFGGSAMQKPMGFSKVTITISNETKILPIDFTEIDITRRLFTDGESEYLINKKACRLKDIHELLMDTGAGTSSYSIMEQGKVDQIITSKPIERRAIFEEAAGITKYQSKKDEAQRKLQRTEEDLLRITDLLSELKKQVGSLKRQANKAERYKELTDELKKLEVQLLYKRFLELSDRNKEIEKEFDEKSKQVIEITTLIAKLEAEQSESSLQSESLNKKLLESNNSKYEFRSNIEKCQSNLELNNSQISNIENLVGKLNTEISQLKAQQTIQVEEISKLSKDLKELDAEIDKEEKKHKEILEHFEVSKGVLKDKIERKSTLVVQIRDLQMLINNLHNELELAKKFKEKFVADKKLIEKQKKELTEKLSSMNDYLDEEREDIRNINIEISSCEKEEVKIDEKLEGLIQSIPKAEQELIELNNEKLTYESRLKALMELQESYEGFSKGVKEILSSAHNGELKGICGVVASLITTEEKYEIAMESALGSGMQNIVIESSEDAKNAIDYLKLKNAGKATFLPLDLIKPFDRYESKDIQSQQGVVGWAIELIEFDDKFKKIAEYLLGNVVIVETLEDAIRLEKMGIRHRYVSLVGDILNPGGSMIGGSYIKSGILGRERELKQYEKEVSRLKSSTEKLQKELDSENEKFNDLNEKKLNLQSSVQKFALIKVSKLKDVDKLITDINNLEKELIQIDDKIKESEDNLLKLENENNQIFGKIEITQKELGTIQIEHSQLEKETIGKDSELDELNKTITDIKVHLASLKERKESTINRMKYLELEVQNSYKLVDEKESEIKTLTQKKNEIFKEIERLSEKIKELEGEHKRLEEICESLNQEKESLVSGLTKLGSELSIQQRNKNILQNELHETDVKKTEFKVQLDNIRKQAEEKFMKGFDELVKEIESLDMDADAIYQQIMDIRKKIEDMGPVNLLAIEEYDQSKERHDFMVEQEKDLSEAKETLIKTIKKIDETIIEMFQKSFSIVREHFKEMFRRLFGGGQADLILTDSENVLEAGVDIVAKPPGKKLQTINLLSGGEKALTAIALLFALFLEKPSPFCVLDEIDAPLDDANIDRFKTLISEFSKTTQFIIITHNKQTMELADTLYGVTMEEPGVSKIISVKFEELDDKMLVG